MKRTYEELEDIGGGHMEAGGFVHYERPTQKTAESRINSQAKVIELWIENAEIECRLEMAQVGWKSIMTSELVDLLPRRAAGKYPYRAPLQIEDQVSVLVDAEWRKTLHSSQRTGHWTIEYTEINGIEIMRIDNGFVYDPYFVRES